MYHACDLYFLGRRGKTLNRVLSVLEILSRNVRWHSYKQNNIVNWWNLCFGETLCVFEDQFMSWCQLKLCFSIFIKVQVILLKRAGRRYFEYHLAVKFYKKFMHVCVIKQIKQIKKGHKSPMLTMTDTYVISDWSSKILKIFNKKSISVSFILAN